MRVQNTRYIETTSKHAFFCMNLILMISFDIFLRFWKCVFFTSIILTFDKFLWGFCRAHLDLHFEGIPKPAQSSDYILALLHATSPWRHSQAVTSQKYGDVACQRWRFKICCCVTNDKWRHREKWRHFAVVTSQIMMTSRRELFLFLHQFGYISWKNIHKNVKRFVARLGFSHIDSFSKYHSLSQRVNPLRWINIKCLFVHVVPWFEIQ